MSNRYSNRESMQFVKGADQSGNKSYSFGVALDTNNKKATALHQPLNANTNQNNKKKLA